MKKRFPDSIAPRARKAGGNKNEGIMSDPRAVDIPRLRKMREAGEKIVMLTAYDYLFARLMDEAGVDLLLVGDTLGMVFQGEQTTIPVTMEQMIYHTRIVARAANRAMVISDMPFLSYHASKEEAVRNAGLLLKKGLAKAVKMEGGTEMAETIARVVEAGIPVMGHIGFKPQSQHQYGHQIVQGKDEAGAKKILEDLEAVQRAGVFSVVIEAVPWTLARELTGRATVPTIGIGAGVHCDGQVLVSTDMLGLFTDFKPKFVKRYARMAEEAKTAIEQYTDELRGRLFPDLEHSSSTPEGDAALAKKKS